MIDFDSDALDLVYLVEVAYHLNGESVKAHWCGPSSRTGGGALAAPEPSSGVMTLWESRLSGGRLDFDLGGLVEGLARVSSATFKVAAGGPDSADLRKAVRDGRWINRTCRLWLYDKTSGDTQHFGDGVVEREPTGWDDRAFSFALRLWPFPDSLKWPTAIVPDGVPSTWDTSDGSSTYRWHPYDSIDGHYLLNPAHYGKRIGPLFGGVTGAVEGLYVELIPYGVAGELQDAAFFWVSPQELCFVQDVWWESEDGTIRPRTPDLGSSEDVLTFVNRDPTRGPLGTCVRVTMAVAADSEKPLWWDEDSTPANMQNGQGHRVFARVSGPGWADFPSTYDPAADPFLTHQLATIPNNFPDLTIPAALPPYRGAWDSILEDLEGDPLLNAGAPYYGVNALSAFAADAPTTFTDKFQCRIPDAPSDEPPSMRAVLSEFMSALQADLCWRLDPATERMAVFPIWRGPRPGDAADFTIIDADLVRVEQPRSLQWVEDPWRDYGTRVELRMPDQTTRPADTLERRHKRTASYVNAAEEGPAEYGGELPKKIARKQWGQYSSVSARHVGEHHTQRQRASEATIGRRGFGVQLGDLIEYRIGDYPPLVGQVRRVTLDLDAVTATITALHIETFPSDGADSKGDEK